MSIGVPAASASNWAWQERSMVMNHHAASSTVCPTVKSPWLRWMVALCGPSAQPEPWRRPLQHDGAAALLAHGVVLVEDAGVLRDRIERAPERGPRLAVDGVGVCGGDDVGARRVHGGVDGERSRVDRSVALDDLTGVAHEDQVRDADVAEAHAEGVHPEVVGQLRVACGDVPGDALGEAEATEQPERPGQLLLAVQALLLHRVELGRASALHRVGARLDRRRKGLCAMAPNYRLPMTYPTAATRDIAAPAEKVWALVTDLPRMGEWSPENAGGKWVKGATGPALGSVFQGNNKNGFRRWSTM